MNDDTAGEDWRRIAFFQAVVWTVGIVYVALAWVVYLGRLLWAPALVVAAAWLIYQNPA